MMGCVYAFDQSNWIYFDYLICDCDIDTHLEGGFDQSSLECSAHSFMTP